MMKHKHLLIASVLTQIFFTTLDANAQWAQVGLTGQIIECFVESGANTSSQMLFAGCYGNGDGIFRSPESGTSWTDVGLPPPSGFALVFALAVTGASTSSPLLFAGVGGAHNFDSAGVFLSTNNGISWSSVNNGLTDSNASISALATIGTNVFAGTDSGVYLTSNNGISWSAVNNGFIAPWQGGFVLPFIYGFATSEAGSSTPMLFAGTPFGVYRTSNNGTSWDHVITGFPDTTTNIHALAVSGSNLLAGTYADGVFLSTNNGTSWTAANGGTTHIGSSTINSFALSGSNVFAASDSGIFLSTNNGESWNSLDTDLNSATYSQAYGVFISSLIVVGSDLFAGTDVGIWRRPLSDYGISAVLPVTSIDNTLGSYPNPFSQSTTISFSSRESGVAEVSVVNILGTEVARIFSGELSSGEHTFSWDASGMTPGMYECVVRMNGRVERMPLVVSR